FQKLAALNGHHIRDSDDDALMAAVEDLARLKAIDLPEPRRSRLREALPGLKERAKTLIELIDLAYYILADRPLAPDEKAAKLLTGEAPALLRRLTSQLRNASAWSGNELEDIVRRFAEDEDLKLGKVAQPMRAALTGRAVSPGVFDVMVTLGPEETLARLDDAAAAAG
ncbi:MAG: glutamate--tRNA ligase, partial [Pseudomonadota bacterium]